MRLDQLGWTQEEIAAKLQAMWPDAKGTSQHAISEFLVEIESFRFQLKNDLDKGHAPDVIAKRYAIPEIMAWNILLDGLDDAARMDKLGIL